MPDMPDYRLILDGTTYYLNNLAGAPVEGGDVRNPSTTPLTLINADWRPSAPEADLVSGGASAELMGLGYAPMTETIPLLCRAGSTERLNQILALLNGHASLISAPGVLWCRPAHAALPILFAVDRVEARAIPLQNGKDPGEGATDVAIQLRVRRSWAGGLSALQTLIATTSVSNSSLSSLGALAGDMQAEGQPLVVRLDKPTSQSPLTVYLASCHSRTTATIGSTLSAITSTAGSAFSASGSLSAAARRAASGVHLHVIARLSALTNPTKAELRVRAESSSGAMLWQGEWVALGSATGTQLVDLGDSSVDMFARAVGASPALILRAELRSTDGTAVTATLATLDAIWAYDWCVITLSSAMGASQRLYCVGADAAPNGGPYLPLDTPEAQLLDGSDILLQVARLAGDAPRAITGASLYVAWADSGGAITIADTANLTVQLAPLWRSSRPLS